MAQTLDQAALDYKPGFVKVREVLVADQTASAAVTDFGSGMRYFRAVIHLKICTVGSELPIFLIETADNTAMNSNVRRLAAQTVPGGAFPLSLVLTGVTPDGGKRYARVVFIPGTGGSGTYDAALAACP